MKDVRRQERDVQKRGATGEIHSKEIIWIVRQKA